MTFYKCDIGDSLTDANGAYGLTPADYRTYRLKQLIDAAYRTNILVRNFGVAGQTSAQILARAYAQFTFKRVPDLISIYAGANDPLLSTTVSGSATTTSIPLAAQSGFNAGDGMAAGASVIIGGQSRIIQSVSAGTITLTQPLSAAPANGATVTIDTRANIVAIVQLGKSAGCSRFIVHEMHMKNWSAGGDDLTSEDATYGPIRVQQRLARADLLAISGIDLAYVDNLTAMRALINSGAEALHSNCWATFANNQHLNCIRMRGGTKKGGQDVLADTEFAAIQAKAAWVAAIRAA
ncbi:SGNH/GDSL hydrolase family protein [Sphingomonas sp. MMS24-J13]|uniref:SGNH/GDSL hydrolase family protein n=1 Tax=Sphingomonas sp. MMS24-J13 TaxID=3238686 RepID=UPI00384B989B